MERATTKSYRTPLILTFSLLMLAGGLYSSIAKATSSSYAGTQLAYYVGYHSGPGYVYYGPRHHYHSRKPYWTNERYRHGCRKSCLIDRWSGRVIRCKRICR